MATFTNKMDLRHFGDASGFDRKLDLVIWPRLQTKWIYCILGMLVVLHFGDACGFDRKLDLVIWQTKWIYCILGMLVVSTVNWIW